MVPGSAIRRSAQTLGHQIRRIRSENPMTKPLETVLADWREKASTLRSVKHQHDAELIDAICDDVARSTEDYTRFLSEADAMLRSGKSADWLRARFAEWAEQGHAEKRKTVR